MSRGLVSRSILLKWTATAWPQRPSPIRIRCYRRAVGNKTTTVMPVASNRMTIPAMAGAGRANASDAPPTLITMTIAFNLSRGRIPPRSFQSRSSPPKMRDCSSLACNAGEHRRSRNAASSAKGVDGRSGRRIPAVARAMQTAAPDRPRSRFSPVQPLTLPDALANGGDVGNCCKRSPFLLKLVQHSVGSKVHRSVGECRGRERPSGDFAGGERLELETRLNPGGEPGFVQKQDAIVHEDR